MQTEMQSTAILTIAPGDREQAPKNCTLKRSAGFSWRGPGIAVLSSESQPTDNGYIEVELRKSPSGTTRFFNKNLRRIRIFNESFLDKRCDKVAFSIFLCIKS
ncbi:hypothetical protein L596_022409 [Steinernema carpocapsae]|uniref:Uncharacterized protein n=1 Tax=Steinernema carpocapsae TaxID=34508 RepID=A0A4V6A089_STECR|nr:hypothetical protein L596_022409 [Steinernema carpocapsae]